MHVQLGFRGEPAAAMRLGASTLLASACGWLLAREVGAHASAMLCASVCLGLVAGSLRRETPWLRALGPLVLAGGAIALAARLLALDWPYAAWPLFACALTAAALGTHHPPLRWLPGLALFGALVPLLSVHLAAERGSPSAVLVGGALVAVAAWLVTSLEVRRVRRELPDEGPYRDTWRSRNAN